MHQMMLEEARRCVAAAESLAARIKSLPTDCGADRRKSVWDAYDWQVRRAEQIIGELKERPVTKPDTYPVTRSRIAFTAASRP
jgi:hypothetical protein